MADRNGSSQTSCDVNGLIEFWSNSRIPHSIFEKNLKDTDECNQCYLTADTKQIPTIVLRLEKLSAAGLAISLWNYVKVLVPELEPHNVEYKKVLEWLSQMNLPEVLAKHVAHRFINIFSLVRDWIHYHYYVLNENRSDRSILYPSGSRGGLKTTKFNILYRCTRLISWYSNGAINYGQTARNLLKSDELDDEAKYILACQYCLKEEIVTRWKTLVENGVVQHAHHFDNSLIGYWNCYCADKLCYVPIRDDESVDEFMIRLFDVDNWTRWTVIEYFFDRLDAEKQIASAIYFIDAGNVEIQDLMLAKMNETQRLNLYTNRGAQIIVNYLDRGGADINEPNAFSIWYKIRDWIAEDQFVSLLKGLCEAEVSNDFLMEIWTSAKQKLKSHILNLDDDEYDFFGEVLRWGCKKYKSGLEFLFTVLKARAAYRSIEWTHQRKWHFKIFCGKLIFNGEFDLLTRLLDNFLPDVNDRSKIRRIMATRVLTEDICKRLTVKGEFRKLKAYANFFYPANIAESKEIANDLLFENIITLMIEDDFPKLKDQFRFGTDTRNDIFSQCFSHKKKMARIILFSNEGMLKLHHLIQDKTFPNVTVKRILSHFFISDRNRRKLRSKLIAFLNPDDPKVRENYLKALAECGL